MKFATQKYFRGPNLVHKFGVQRNGVYSSKQNQASQKFLSNFFIVFYSKIDIGENLYIKNVKKY